MKRQASVLIGLLWCLVILSVVVIGALHSARLDLRIAKNQGDAVQAHYLALAGIEKAKALLYHDAVERKRSAKHHSGALYNAPESFRDIQLGRGQFRVFRQPRPGEGEKTVYGISDEEGRLNLNTASAEDLARLYGMTPDIVAAIVDWKDGNNAVTPGGAEADYYSSRQPPGLPRNGPFQTVRELLMVRGVTRELLMGEDANQNGLLDPEENDGDETLPRDNRDGYLDAGWSGAITVGSVGRNRNAAGEERVNVQQADEKALTGVRGISPDLAKAIVAYRGQRQLENLSDLLDVTAVNPQNQSPPQQAPVVNQPGSRSRSAQAAPGASRSTAQPSGPKLISEDLFMEIADDVTTTSDEEQAGAININTASVDVLACLPGVSRELAQAIVSYRKSAGFFPNIAWLLKVDGMDREVFKEIAPKVTARSETFRILSEGKVTSSGARKRIEVVVRFGSFNFDTLSYREDL